MIEMNNNKIKEALPVAKTAAAEKITLSMFVVVNTECVK
jgi:hypothetical protein